jgi:hypothetical protein
MIFEFAVRFDSGGQTVSERSRDMAQRFAASRESQGIQNEKTVQDRKILHEAFRRMCEEFRQAFKSSIDELSQEPEIGDLLGYKTSDSGLEISRNDTGEILQVKFDVLKNAVKLECKTPIRLKQSLQVKLSTDGINYWLADGDGNGMSDTAVMYMVDKSLNALLGTGS